MRGEYGAQPTQISIHAPARGATVGKDANVLADVISIHAPARGATCRRHLQSTRKTEFQSTLPRGERRWMPWSVTGAVYFNPRSREGSDLGSCKLSCRLCYFNPRSREGSDLCAFFRVLCSVISIRAPARGATKQVLHRSDPRMISIRAPARGATNKPITLYTFPCISIRAPARGATIVLYSLQSSFLFQSALPRGERHQFSPKNSLLS